jgi:hypothetical protein
MTVEFESLKLLPQMYALIEKLSKQLENGNAKRWLSVKELAVYLSYSSERIYKIKEEHFIINRQDIEELSILMIQRQTANLQ